MTNKADVDILANAPEGATHINLENEYFWLDDDEQFVFDMDNSQWSMAFYQHSSINYVVRSLADVEALVARDEYIEELEKYNGEYREEKGDWVRRLILEGKRNKELEEKLTDLSKCFDGCYEELQATRDATDAYVSTLEHEVEWLDRQLTRYMLKYNKAVDNLQRENKR